MSISTNRVRYLFNINIHLLAYQLHHTAFAQRTQMWDLTAMHENAEENSERYLKTLEKAGKWILSAAGFKCYLSSFPESCSRAHRATH